MLVSHAGLADVPLAVAMDRDSSDGVLWRRGPAPAASAAAGGGPHAHRRRRARCLTTPPIPLYIDTGAVFGRNLTGVRLSPTGEVLDMLLIPVDPADLPD